MLIEQREVRQNPGELSRRLFWDDAIDLAVWFRPDGGIEQFQLSYDPDNEPRVLTWSQGKGFSHTSIDYGNDDLEFNRAPILGPTGELNVPALRARFLAAAATIPPSIRALIDEQLRRLSPC